MPCLTIFGRDWSIGSDDLALPAAAELIVNAGWVCVLSWVPITHRSGFMHCSTSMKLFYAGGILYACTNIALLARIISVSLKGTLINAWPRRHIVLYIKGKLVLDLCGAGFLLWATMMAPRGHEIDCEEAVSGTMKSAMRFAWSSMVAVVAGIWLVFRPVADKQGLDAELPHRSADKLDTLLHPENLFTLARVIKRKVKNLWLRMLGLERHPAISEVGKFMTQCFPDKVPLVASDVVVGLYLVRKQQLQSQSATPTHKLPPPKQSWMNAHTASHYMKYALGAYGWFYYILSYNIYPFGVFKLLYNSRWIPKPNPAYLEQDNMCLTNTTVIKLTTGLTDDELVFVDFHNEVWEVPFYIGLDHSEKTVVVAIRGTLSIQDIITDLYAFESEAWNLLDVPNASAHSGFLAAARYLCQRLIGPVWDGVESDSTSDSDPLLDRAFNQLKQSGRNPDDYNLVVVGHSLGAGVAAILAVMLRQLPRFHNLRCFAFSPPGGSVCKAVASYAEEFVCSVILGDDFVGHLGLASAFDFKIQLFQAIKNCDSAKHEIFKDWLERVLRKVLTYKSSSPRDKTLPSWHGNASAQIMTEQFQMTLSKAIKANQSLRVGFERLYPAGHVMHLTETEVPSSWWYPWKKYRYGFEWCKWNSSSLRNLVLSDNMVRHHTPWMVMEALQKSVRL